MAKIKIEGTASLGINSIVCVCGHCGNNDREDALIEFNFQKQCVMYICSKCKKENTLPFGKDRPAPYPRSRVGVRP